MVLNASKFFGKPLIYSLAICSFAAPALLADSIPLISAVTQSGQPPQLTITGSNFGTIPPVVTLNGLAVPVMSYTNSLVVVTVPTSIESAPGTYILTLTNNSDSSYDPLRTTAFVVAIGAVGPAGPAGVAGPQGIAGPSGPAGATGPAGTAGLAGPTGPAGAIGAVGPVGPIGLTGATGAAGAIGPAGPQGLVGPAGPSGPQGLAGLIGPAGPTGPPGLQGPTGLTGPMGPAGASGPSAAFINSSQSSVANVTTAATQVASLSNLPAGNYLLSAKVNLQFNGGAAGQDLCVLNVGGAQIDQSYATVSLTAGIMFETAKLLGSASFPTGTNSITVTCATTNGTVAALNPVLMATQVGSLTEQ